MSLLWWCLVNKEINICIELPLSTTRGLMFLWSCGIFEDVMDTPSCESSGWTCWMMVLMCTCVILYLVSWLLCLLSHEYDNRMACQSLMFLLVLSRHWAWNTLSLLQNAASSVRYCFSDMLAARFLSCVLYVQLVHSFPNCHLFAPTFATAFFFIATPCTTGSSLTSTSVSHERNKPAIYFHELAELFTCLFTPLTLPLIDFSCSNNSSQHQPSKRCIEWYQWISMTTIAVSLMIWRPSPMTQVLYMIYKAKEWHALLGGITHWCCS